MTERAAGATATLGRLREALLVWVVPAFPFLFLGLPLGGPDKTLSVPKIVLLLAVALTLVTLRRPAAARLRRLPVVALAAYALATLIGAATVASAWYALREVLIALFIIGVWTSPPRAARAFWRHLTVVAWLLSGWAVLLWQRGESLTSLATQVVGTRNVAASFLIVVLLSCLAGRRFAVATAPTLGLLALRSVGGWLGLAFGVLMLWRRRGGRALVAAVVYAAAVLTVAANVPLRPGAAERDQAERFWSTSVMPRLYGWRVIVPEVLHRPWLGHGLGTFPDVFLATEARTVPLDQRPWWRRDATGRPAPGMPAHDDLLRIAIESGLPAAGLWLLAMLLFVYDVRRHRLARALLVAFLVETLTDNLYMLSNVAPVVFTAVALARGAADGAEAVDARGERGIGERAGRVGAAGSEELEPGAGVEPATY